MEKSKYEVPYGRSLIAFTLPPGMKATTAISQPAPALPDVPAAIAAALARPIGSPPLHELARPGDHVCIVFTDCTRASPDHLMVPALLAELAQAGVRDEHITLLCGIGMHRPSTTTEKVAKLGQDVVARYRVIDSEPDNPNALVDLGITAGGLPVQLHRAAAEADLLLRRRARARIAWPFSMGSSRSGRRRSRVAFGPSTDAREWQKNTNSSAW